MNIIKYYIFLIYISGFVFRSFLIFNLLFTTHITLNIFHQYPIIFNIMPASFEIYSKIGIDKI